MKCTVIHPSVYIQTYIREMCVRCVQLFITYTRLLYAVVVDAVLVVAMFIHVSSALALGTFIPHYTAPHHCTHYVWAVVRGTRWIERIAVKAFVFTTPDSHQQHSLPLLTKQLWTVSV